VHHHAVILGSGDFEGALSEGVSDFLAATFTGDPAMGRGFFYNSQPLRHIDPSKNRVWPDDVVGEVHQDGRIIGETLWDLRKAMIAKLGESEGVAHTNDLYYQAIKNASDIPTMYAEVLAADDDDGNLENGTPNVCEIVDAFALHGLRTLNVASSKLAVEPPTQVGHHISLEIEGLFDQCQSDSIDGATVIWHTERKPSVVETVVMDGGPTLFEGVIAPQLPGEVVRYRVEALLSAGTKLSFPANAADPTYQFFVGEVTPIYCTDFEADPNTYGWTHGLLAGASSEGADDWQWDTPMGGAHNGDPSSAFSGFYVFGNDLGHDKFNGLYQKNKTNFADSPVINVAGFDNVRLQYRRWLNVEDGFFDRATIYANGQPAWQNLATTSDGDTHHSDREWRFHDVDLSDFVSPEGTVQLRWEIASDDNLQLGGWTLDDVCVVAYEGPPPVDPRCGDGVLQPGEGCDDGNVAANDGCNALCQPEDEGDNALTETGPDLTVGGGCGCGAAGSGKPRAPLAWILLGLGAMLFRRRRP
jgi:MYXO-CTERM domain-containing protein